MDILKTAGLTHQTDPPYLSFQDAETSPYLYVEIVEQPLPQARISDALGYKYEILGAPVTLTSGTAYRIASYETSGGDSWRDIGSLSNHSSAATIQYGVHDNQTNGYPSYTYGSSEQGYVPPVFYY